MWVDKNKNSLDQTEKNWSKRKKNTETELDLA